MRKSEFSLEDFTKILKSFKMLGSMEQILGMLPIPGLNKDMRAMISSTGESHMKKIEVIIQSMTVAERRKPDIIKESRRLRIANGCGLPEEEISQFLVQFEQMRMIMKQLTKMTDGMRNETNPSPMAGLKMPRSMKKKKNTGGLEDMFGASGFPGMPGMGGGGFPGMPKMPGGKMPKLPPGMKLPPGFPQGGNFPPGFFDQ